jgi:hypothetical protein
MEATSCQRPPSCVLEKRSQRLAQLITPVGSEALLARAVYREANGMLPLASGPHPFMAEVTTHDRGPRLLIVEGRKPT